MMMPGFPPEHKMQIRPCQPDINAFSTQIWDTQGTLNF